MSEKAAEKILAGLKEALEIVAEQMPVTVVESIDEAAWEVTRQSLAGYRLAATSNAGLPEPKRRLTFLPHSAFVDAPLPSQGDVR